MPEKDELTEAVRDWERKERAASRANLKQRQAKDAKDAAKEEVKRILAERKQRSVGAGSSVVSTYVFNRYYVVEAERPDFEEWAKDQDEEYLEPTRRVREEALKGLCEELEQNKQPLPPGVRKYPETRISKRRA